jgi:hypothetical protein
MNSASQKNEYDYSSREFARSETINETEVNEGSHANKEEPETIVVLAILSNGEVKPFTPGDWHLKLDEKESIEKNITPSLAREILKSRSESAVLERGSNSNCHDIRINGRRLIICKG